MYQSSRLTYLHKYFIFPLNFALFTFLTISIWMRGNVLEYYWHNFAAPMAIWCAIWFAGFIIRLRRVQADASGIAILPLFGNAQKVEYKNIEYVSEIALMLPTRFSLKYTDPKTLKARRIHVMPGQCYDMTQFIRQRIAEENPAYSPAAEPSRWSMMRLAFLTALPFMLYGVVQNVATWLAH